MAMTAHCLESLQEQGRSYTKLAGDLDFVTDQLLYSVDLLLVRESTGAVVPEEVEEVGGLGDIQTHVVPVIKVLC